MRNPLVILLWIFLLPLCFCKRKNIEEEAKSIKRSYEAYLPEVSVIRLEKKDFHKELISNGTLQALRKADIKLSASGRIMEVNVINGDKVAMGTVLARQDDTEARINLAKSKIEYQQASLELEDQLMAYGVSIADTSSMNKKALETMKIKSGFIHALLALKEAECELNKTQITALFSGRIANLEAKKHNYVEGGSDLCKLIDDSKFEVIFPVIESELGLLRKGQTVMVKPFAIQGSYEGVISEVNPLVDENGLVQVKALVQNNDRRLIEGLNVRVNCQQKVRDQLVIPKEALVQRDGRKVVFTLRNDSIAYWNYVQVGLENAQQYTIVDGLNAGDLIITEGNLNLAHESIVKVNPMVIHSNSTHTSF